MEKKSKNFAIRSVLLLMLALTLFIAHDTTGQRKRPLKMMLVPDTVMRQNAVTLLSLEKIISQQDSTILNLKAAIIEKDSAQKATTMMLTESEFREKVLLKSNEKEQGRTEFWKGTAVKYRRQRNLSLGAVALVVVVGTVKSLKR